MHEANLVQVEFFHTDFETEETSVRDITGRYMDGLRLSLGGVRNVNPGIKTTVRFYDYSGELTEAALASERTVRLQSELYEKIMPPHTLSRWRMKLLDFESRRLSKRKSEIKKHACTLAAKLVHKAVASRCKVVVERYDPNRSFTLLHKDETHELLEGIDKATHAWIFVFKPNDLMSRDNVSIATLF